MIDKTTVILVDDHHLVRAGIRALLEDLKKFDVIGEAADGKDVMPLLKKVQPDVLVLDITMKQISGIEILPEIRFSYPNLPIVMLTMHNTRDYLQTAFELGANAFLLKDSAEVELELAIESVLNNQKYISPKLSEQMLETMHEEEAIEASNVLTVRQTQILKMLAEGKGTKEIAFDLNLSVKTIESHRAQIMDRLQIRDLASLVRYAIKRGITTL
jgi:DNA-binding NarL/FixJ family response regulator